MQTLTFSSRLSAPRERVWEWITSKDGILAEMRPVMRMTMPKNMALTEADVVPGKRLFRSYILLFGVIPFDRSDLTLVSFDPGRGFVEESPMASMKLWRHERTIGADPENPAGVILTDRLTFAPRFAEPLAAAFVRFLFTHRHKVLRRSFAPAS
ncbi:MAG: hypothetical protein AB1921_08125 [Thermodesulfobacteriota bacterium]